MPMRAPQPERSATPATAVAAALDSYVGHAESPSHEVGFHFPFALRGSTGNTDRRYSVMAAAPMGVSGGVGVGLVPARSAPPTRIWRLVDCTPSQRGSITISGVLRNHEYSRVTRAVMSRNCSACVLGAAVGWPVAQPVNPSRPSRKTIVFMGAPPLSATPHGCGRDFVVEHVAPLPLHLLERSLDRGGTGPTWRLPKRDHAD